MAISAASLTAYVDETRIPLIGKTVMAPRSLDVLTMQTGVKGKAAINLLTNTTTFGNGAACGWNEAGTSALSQREIVTGAIKINKAFCDKTLLNYWAGYDVKVAAGAKTLPFEQEFINAEVEGVGNALEVAIWQGDVSSGTANLSKFDGLIKIIDAASASTINVTVDPSTTSTITTSNVITIVDNVFNGIPSDLLDKDDVYIVMGIDTYTKYIQALRAANLYHYNPNDNDNLEYPYPGFMNVKVKGVKGLNATNRVFAFRKSNVFYGTDLENDHEVFKFWYSEDNREFRLAIEFVAGVQIAFPDQVVRFKLPK